MFFFEILVALKRAVFKLSKMASVSVSVFNIKVLLQAWWLTLKIGSCCWPIHAGATVVKNRWHCILFCIRTSANFLWLLEVSEFEPFNDVTKDPFHWCSDTRHSGVIYAFLSYRIFEPCLQMHAEWISGISINAEIWPIRSTRYSCKRAYYSWLCQEVAIMSRTFQWTKKVSYQSIGYWYGLKFESMDSFVTIIHDTLIHWRSWDGS